MKPIGFTEEDEFDSMSVSEMLSKQDREQDDELSVIYRHYVLNDSEKYAFPYYRRIVNLFQYPNVCLMTEWLQSDARREKCADLIKALIEKPLPA